MSESSVPSHSGASCCHATPEPLMESNHHAHSTDVAPATSNHTSHAHLHNGHGNGSLINLTTSATLHCLVGCGIGELIGLSIGVTLGLAPWATIVLATTLGFAFGFALGLVPLLRRGMNVAQAFKAIWLGELISISVMEVAMNFTDYHVGGITAPSIMSLVFWTGYGAALVAGFVAAWPVNYWMLSRSIKKPCH